MIDHILDFIFGIAIEAGAEILPDPKISDRKKKEYLAIGILAVLALLVIFIVGVDLLR